MCLSGCVLARFLVQVFNDSCATTIGIFVHSFLLVLVRFGYCGVNAIGGAAGAVTV